MVVPPEKQRVWFVVALESEFARRRWVRASWQLNKR
jgi:hypothetical protein